MTEHLSSTAGSSVTTTITTGLNSWCNQLVVTRTSQQPAITAPARYIRAHLDEVLHTIEASTLAEPLRRVLSVYLEGKLVAATQHAASAQSARNGRSRAIRAAIQQAQGALPAHLPRFSRAQVIKRRISARPEAFGLRNAPSVRKIADCLSEVETAMIGDYASASPSS